MVHEPMPGHIACVHTTKQFCRDLGGGVSKTIDEVRAGVLLTMV
jgi:hypothetical protein